MVALRVSKIARLAILSYDSAPANPIDNWRRPQTAEGKHLRLQLQWIYLGGSYSKTPPLGIYPIPWYIVLYSIDCETYVGVKMSPK